mmetsp:Transcript_72456/g.120795  ORF Transcript_72456/g.120795 Transcript_72456/m.120795 type:complete len:124 (-) Transcript_72456:227-598(-)|eukprot:CAMPEP_0119308462 /NCGR_PEP_ID=MMETSP1333-20130426/10959_1 /TAXON_ID=418940 /ORGANISM="Scyphosphaera apsteinii, Strain RCC1455" /LENGTH=123 /DNA_ID=CAMNT_0007312227 /DNA_START=124 /DNA_END=495 /DNA_ORIENTATION=+
MEIGQAVELIGVENAGLDITGKRGTVTEIPGHGLISVTIDGSGAVVSAWPENLKILSCTRNSISMEIGLAVEITGVKTEGLDINGKRGMVTETPECGLVSVTIDGSGEVVSVKPQNLTRVASI